MGIVSPVLDTITRDAHFQGQCMLQRYRSSRVIRSYYLGYTIGDYYAGSRLA